MVVILVCSLKHTWLSCSVSFRLWIQYKFQVGANGMFGGQAASLGGGQLPPLPRPRTATACSILFIEYWVSLWVFLFLIRKTNKHCNITIGVHSNSIWQDVVRDLLVVGTAWYYPGWSHWSLSGLQAVCMHGSRNPCARISLSESAGALRLSKWTGILANALLECR